MRLQITHTAQAPDGFQITFQVATPPSTRAGDPHAEVVEAAQKELAGHADFVRWRERATELGEAQRQQQILQARQQELQGRRRQLELASGPVGKQLAAVDTELASVAAELDHGERVCGSLRQAVATLKGQVSKHVTAVVEMAMQSKRQALQTLRTELVEKLSKRLGGELADLASVEAADVQLTNPHFAQAFTGQACAAILNALNQP